MSKSIKRRAVARAVLCLSLLVIAGTAWAQAGGTLTGTVRDQSGAAVAGANLTLTSTATQVQLEHRHDGIRFLYDSHAASGHV